MISVKNDQAFKVADAASYDEHVADFGRFASLMTTPLAQRMVAMARIAPGQRVLDIGTGTGVVAIAAASAMGNTGKVTGIDLSEKMIAAASEAVRRKGYESRIDLHVMDGEALRFDDRSFDVVVALFALLHFPNPDRALQEMFRVLKPGGILVIAVGSEPPWLSTTGLTHALDLLPHLVARLRGRELVAPKFLNQLVDEDIPATDEPEESPLAQKGRNRSQSVPELVRAAGFTDLREHWEGHQGTLETAEDFWDIQRTFSSIARKRLKSAAPERVAKVRAKFDDRCAAVLSRGGTLSYPFAGFFVFARRPLD